MRMRTTAAISRVNDDFRIDFARCGVIAILALIRSLMVSVSAFTNIDEPCDARGARRKAFRRGDRMGRAR